jgi:hypothetical protein
MIMKSISSVKIIIAGALSALFCGCATQYNNTSAKRLVVEAVYVAKPPVLDGTLNDPAWLKAPACKLAMPRRVYSKSPKAMLATLGTEMREEGEFRLLWDHSFLYIGVNFTDSDVHAYGEEDNLHHYSLGDVAEVFLKPANDTYYWELYATPTGKKTSFFFPARGCRLSPLMKSSPLGLSVSSRFEGTLNQWGDRDTSWSAVMVIPRKDLEQYGAKFGPGTEWLIFMARYNYSRYLPAPELSSYPQQAETPNFHIHEEYATLKFVNGK